MAWTNWGFDGTINEAQWAQMAGLLGNGYVAAGNGDCVVTAVGGARSVSVAAGTLYGDGIVSVNSAPETVAMTTPVNGQWYVIALRRTWATNTAALVAIAGATTTTTTPTAPPTSFPTLNTNVGVLTDQPIAWAWCNSANTTVVVYDIRLKAVKSLPPVVANGTERDAKFMTPTQGLQVWRDDLGAVETYFGLYNSITNPGGRDTAGWYIDGRSGGLIPIRPTSAVIATGTGSANSLGVVSFNGATAISLNGVFTSAYENYRIIFKAISSLTSYPGVAFRVRSNGTDASTNAYQRNAINQDGTGAVSAWWDTNNSTAFFSGGIQDTHQNHSVIDIFQPALSARTSAFYVSRGWRGAFTYSTGAILHTETTSYDGISILPGGGTLTGSIQVFGYND